MARSMTELWSSSIIRFIHLETQITRPKTFEDESKAFSAELLKYLAAKNKTNSHGFRKTGHLKWLWFIGGLSSDTGEAKTRVDASSAKRRLTQGINYQPAAGLSSINRWISRRRSGRRFCTGQARLAVIQRRNVNAQPVTTGESENGRVMSASGFWNSFLTVSCSGVFPF